MKFSEEVVLENFHNMVNSDHSSIAEFVGNNFDTEGTELESVQAKDWIETPGFVEHIEDEDFKKLALKMNSIWKHLTRRMNKTRQEIEEKSSLIYLENAFVVPGGRLSLQSLSHSHENHHHIIIIITFFPIIVFFYHHYHY